MGEQNNAGTAQKPDNTAYKKKGLVVSVLHEISLVAVRVKDVSMLLKEVLDILYAQMNLTRGTVTLKNGDVLVIRASHGLSEEERRRGVYRVGEGVTGDVAARGVSRIVEDISKSPDFLNRTGSRHMDVKTAFLCVPIISQNNVIGTLSIDRENPTSYELKRDLKLLETIANIIAYAVSVLFLDMEENEKLNAENRDLRERIDQELRPENAIGTSPAMLKAYELISAAGESSSHILIRGEVGAGKDFAMRAIANAKMWRDKPLEILDCSTMRDSLIDAALFGSQSPTHRSTPGLVEKADGGIVYLDSMGLIGQPLQVKLLKFMTDGTYTRCSETKIRRSGARIIASTSGDLETRLRNGIIRPDFYYHLSVFTINIPPLRQRRRDIPQLAKFFLQKHSALRNKKITSISPAAMNMLCAYHWPSNVRELENCIERAVIISAGPSILESDLPPSLQTPQSTNTSKLKADENIDFKKMVENFEREIIVEVLAANGGNASAAARQLSVSRRILNYKIANLDITPKSFKQKRRSDAKKTGSV